MKQLFPWFLSVISLLTFSFSNGQSTTENDMRFLRGLATQNSCFWVDGPYENGYGSVSTVPMNQACGIKAPPNAVVCTGTISCSISDENAQAYDPGKVNEEGYAPYLYFEGVSCPGTKSGSNVICGRGGIQDCLEKSHSYSEVATVREKDNPYNTGTIYRLKNNQKSKVNR